MRVIEFLPVPPPPTWGSREDVGRGWRGGKRATRERGGDGVFPRRVEYDDNSERAIAAFRHGAVDAITMTARIIIVATGDNDD